MRGLRTLVLALAVSAAAMVTTIPLVSADPGTEFDLVADGGDPSTAVTVGKVLVSNDATTLTVTYQITRLEWCLTETYLHVAEDANGNGVADPEEIPQSNGNPSPGQFDYQGIHDCVVSYTYQIPLSSWSPGTDLVIAAHAEVANRGSQQTVVVYSDEGLTQVVAGNVPGAVYPYPAVDSYEAQQNPPDSIPSWADYTLVLDGQRFFFQQADWVWESFMPVDYTIDECAAFEHVFTSPEGFVADASLYITADNSHAVSLNGAFLGESQDPFAWQTVRAYQVSLLDGLNVLEVVACNLGAPDWEPWENPAGLIYEVRIATFSTEGAWAGDYAFPGGNWATYFCYEVVDVGGTAGALDPSICLPSSRKGPLVCMS